MVGHASLFSQVLSLIDRGHFARSVKALNAERGAKGFTCWGQLVAMLFCQLAQACFRRGHPGDVTPLPFRTTAAGDTFIGYFAASLIRGLAPDRCLAYACKAAAISVTRKGAANSIPAATEVFRPPRRT